MTQEATLGLPKGPWRDGMTAGIGGRRGRRSGQDLSCWEERVA